MREAYTNKFIKVHGIITISTILCVVLRLCILNLYQRNTIYNCYTYCLVGSTLVPEFRQPRQLKLVDIFSKCNKP